MVYVTLDTACQLQGFFPNQLCLYLLQVSIILAISSLVFARGVLCVLGSLRILLHSLSHFFLDSRVLTNICQNFLMFFSCACLVSLSLGTPAPILVARTANNTQDPQDYKVISEKTDTHNPQNDTQNHQDTWIIYFTKYLRKPITQSICRLILSYEDKTHILYVTRMDVKESLDTTLSRVFSLQDCTRTKRQCLTDPPMTLLYPCTSTLSSCHKCAIIISDSLRKAFRVGQGGSKLSFNIV